MTVRNLTAAEAIEKMKTNRANMEAATIQRRQEAGSARGSLLRAFVLYRVENTAASKEEFLAWALEQIP